MSWLIIGLILLVNIVFFSILFDKIFIVILLSIQFSLLIIYLVNFIGFWIKNRLNVKKIEKIDDEDKEKFKYYGDILNDYSIGELGYLFNGRKNLKLLIAAEIESLKLRGKIDIDGKNIIINDQNGCSYSEIYIMNHYKFINNEEFILNYEKHINSALREKNLIQDQVLEGESMILFFVFMLFVVFFLIYIFSLYSTQLMHEEFGGRFIVTEVIFFVLFWFVCTISMISFGRNKRGVVKTEMGKEIFLKLFGLKNYIDDFGLFDDKKLNEISLWKEYILYAIILGESRALTKELKFEYEKCVDIVNGVY